MCLGPLVDRMQNMQQTIFIPVLGLAALRKVVVRLIFKKLSFGLVVFIVPQISIFGKNY